jgi:hypothetical protein
MICITNWWSHFQFQVLTQNKEVGLDVNLHSVVCFLWWTLEESKSEGFDLIPAQVWLYIAEKINWLLL